MKCARSAAVLVISRLVSAVAFWEIAHLLLTTIRAQPPNADERRPRAREAADVRAEKSPLHFKLVSVEKPIPMLTTFDRDAEIAVQRIVSVSGLAGHLFVPAPC